MPPLGQTPKREALTLHFLPEGTEHRFAHTKPNVGDHMTRGDETWSLSMCVRTRTGTPS
jgi:hypothetical protein